MAKGIIIKDCSVCPNRSHGGAFARPSYVPQCDHYKRPKNLPYKVELKGSHKVAVATEVIPSWCPLDNIKE